MINKKSMIIILSALVVGIVSGTIISKIDFKKKTEEITIDNRCEITAQALEKIYEDEDYEYYLSSISSGCIYVTVNDSEYTLKEVIDKKVLTIQELEENGLKVYKEEK